MSRFIPFGRFNRSAILALALLLGMGQWLTTLYGDERDASPEPATRSSKTDDGHEPAQQHREKRPFPVFDAMMFQGQPEMDEFGMQPINLIGGRLWPNGEAATQPQERRIRSVARAATRRGQLVCLDIEHWKTRRASEETLEKNIQKLAQIADWMHDTTPELRLGYYSILPARDYWTPVRGKTEMIEQWHQHNARMKSLARHVDVVFPSLYTFYNKPEDWEKYARANLRQAKQYHKQVYVFLCPTFHISNDELRGQPIPGEFWRRQLEVCYEEADGIVIWGGWQQQWDEDAEWWVQTQLFLKKIKRQ